MRDGISDTLNLSLATENGSQRADVRLARAARGDRAALAELYTEHHVALRDFCWRLLGDSSAAEDLVHDVFVELGRDLSRYRGECSLLTFLRAIAVHRCQRHLRAATRRRRAMMRLAQETERQGRFLPEEIRRRELARRLSAALDVLPLAQRAAFVLCEVEELSSEEAARILEIPAATVRTRVFHARKRLGELLGGAP
ncbi:MAG: RNA polymerase sigma factor [Myxococcales bacterium]